MIQNIENMTVAIVGPAFYMTDSNLGTEIDEHDIVVRINRSYEITKESKKDVGERTDVLYSCLIEKPDNAGKLCIEKLNDHNIKLICTPPFSDMKGIANTNSLHPMTDIENLKKINKEIPIRIIDFDINNKIATKINCRPNTGFLAIFDMLRMKPKKLSIYGFSFYLDGFYNGVKSGISVSEDEFVDKCFNSKRHVQKNMWKYAKETILNHKNVSLDKNLELILNLKEFSKDAYSKLLINKEL